MPCHLSLDACLAEYIEAAGIRTQIGHHTFRATGSAGCQSPLPSVTGLSYGRCGEDAPYCWMRFDRHG